MESSDAEIAQFDELRTLALKQRTEEHPERVAMKEPKASALNELARNRELANVSGVMWSWVVVVCHAPP